MERLIGGESIPVIAHDGGRDPFAAPSVEATPQSEGFTLEGKVRCVKHADVATEFLVTERLGQETAIFRYRGPRSRSNPTG